MEGGHLIIQGFAVIAAGLEDQNLEAGQRQPRRQRTAAGAGADDHIVGDDLFGHRTTPVLGRPSRRLEKRQRVASSGIGPLRRRGRESPPARLPGHGAPRPGASTEFD